MVDGLKVKMYSFTMDCAEPVALAEFYAALLEWEVVFSDAAFACVGAPGSPQGGYPGITFQQNAQYQAPVWPQQPGQQAQMAHLDFAVNDLSKAVEHAVRCGAQVAQQQFSDSWTVLFDPEGHPFCLCQMQAVMESPDFSLL